MTEAPRFERPPVLQGERRAAVDPRVATESAADPRVAMVLAVLAGRTAEDVALEWGIEPSLVHRWTRDFLRGGSSQVTNRPDPDQALQRDRFLAAFAHELRTPITVAKGWAMALCEGDVPDELVTASLDHLSDALTRLSEHILDVEMAASVSLGRLAVATEPLDVGALCAALEGSPAVRHGADVTVTGDPRLLGRVLRDLWDTARRDPAPDSVAIDVVETRSWHEIRVVREGHQISPIVLRALLDPFDTNDDATGVTMGLYMARALVVAHGGVLGAEGDEDRTVLFARLPRDPAMASAADRAEEPS